MAFLPKDELWKEVKLTWRNIEASLQFFKDRIIVHLFVDNVCVDKREIVYDEVPAIKELKEKVAHYEAVLSCVPSDLLIKIETTLQGVK